MKDGTLKTIILISLPLNLLEIFTLSAVYSIAYSIGASLSNSICLTLLLLTAVQIFYVLFILFKFKVSGIYRSLALLTIVVSVIVAIVSYGFKGSF